MNCQKTTNSWSPHPWKQFDGFFGKIWEICSYRPTCDSMHLLVGRWRIIGGEKLTHSALRAVRPGRGEPSCVHVTLTFPPQEIDFWLIIHLAEEKRRRINHNSSQKLLKLLSSSNLAYCKGLKRGCEANWWLVLLFFWGLLILVPALGSPLEMWSKYQCFQSSQSDTWTARDNPRVFDSGEGKHAQATWFSKLVCPKLSKFL